MNILNLYSGIGGNRKFWGDEHKITAVECNAEIAKVYQDYFPNDTVIVGDAHQYLLDHYKEFDFIWSSPPCPTHSDARRMGVHKGQVDALYPDMSLWQEIILLKHFHKKGSFYCVENVKPYYDTMFSPQIRDRHCFWANFYIHDYNNVKHKHHKTIDEKQKITGFDLSKYKNVDKNKVLRNCVDSELGLHILNSAIKNIQRGLFDEK